MRRHHHVCFDEYVPLSQTVWTEAQYNAKLASTDQLAIHAVGDNASAVCTANIYLEHSSDGRSWLFRSTNATTPPAAAEITLSFAGGDLQQKMWSDACLGTSANGPLLGFVRLRVIMSSGSGAHIKIHVTHRDGAT